MLGRMVAGPEPGGGGVSEQRRPRDAAFDFFGGGRRTHTGTAAAVPLPSSPMAFVPPTKLFLADDGEEEAAAAFSPPAPELAAEAVVVMVSPTSTLQAPTTNSPTSPAATTTAVLPFSRRGAVATTTTTTTSSSSSSAGMDDDDDRRSQRPWEVRPIGVGLAGALNVGDGDGAVPSAATTVLTVTGQRIRPSSSAAALGGLSSRPAESSRSRCRRRRCVLSAREMMESASSSEDYTRVIARGANTRTTHIFDGRVVVVVEGADEFLRWCHGCSKDLGQGNDIFMYRGEMAFCSHECRYREMLLFDDEEESYS